MACLIVLMRTVLMRPVLAPPILAHRPAVAQNTMPLHRQRPFTAGAPSPSHHSATDPQTPQTPQHPLKAANISKRPQSNSKKPPHRIGKHQIDIDKREVGLSGKARLPVGVKALWPSLFRAGQHARNQTGILDRSGGKPAGLRLTSALRRHAKNSAQ